MTSQKTIAVTRRALLRSACATGLFYSGLPLLQGALAHSSNPGLSLIADPDNLLDLPEGFTYQVVSRTGGMMSDGLFRPGRPDGMACFADPDSADRCILMRNHENWPDTEDGSPFGADEALADQLTASQLYDRKADGRPFTGGVTKTVYNMKTGEIEQDMLALAGTTGNCAGGATPWGSWLSCEESDVTTGDGAGKPHGFVFEVPSSATGPVDATPLKAMGRFTHEAAAVDPDSGIVYLTEDNSEGLFYRFIPNEPGELAKGGKLQALAIRGWKSADTSNWPRDWGGGGADAIETGRDYEVDWLDMEDVEAPDGDLAERGFAAGAARFTRGEGMAYGRQTPDSPGDIFFNCTNGGAARTGQVWRYRPGSDGSAGILTMLYESPGPDTLDLCDNLAIAPWGDLILCEDGAGDQYLRGLTPDGKIYDLARNAHPDGSEFCGACFSPDGNIMFVNIQEPGITLAIEGPWASIRNG